MMELNVKSPAYFSERYGVDDAILMSLRRD